MEMWHFVCVTYVNRSRLYKTKTVSSTRARFINPYISIQLHTMMFGEMSLKTHSQIFISVMILHEGYEPCTWDMMQGWLLRV